MTDTTRTCAGCDTPIIPGPRERNRKKWCSQACRQRYLRRTSPEYAERRKELSAERLQEARKLNPLRQCVNCGENLARLREDWEYCNKPECRSAKYHAGKSKKPSCAEPGCGKPSIAKGVCGSHYKLQWRKLNPDKAIAADHRYRSRKRDAWVEDVSRTVVLERDNWTCHLCGETIPQNIKYPHRQYGTLDHVLPLAKGGTHEYANVKAAHFICNALKQDNEEWAPDGITGQR